ncbi:hypothetical protein CY0110_19492 [Crocosphaera chwakensis CCY0110]|uniref:Uncharacterized protein n=1 Tax=Crocosphaera chwakensis CCY0110 TaxID=391612 RepID=A3IJN0_9CHRO|nr:hypothetical protein CY0110_19492 [Crocosphaera chwakensis CCY0110]
MITFSFRPRNQSDLPSIAASVKTRVVSWKEAALIKLSVFKEALVIPNKTGVYLAGAPPVIAIASFTCSICRNSTNSPGSMVVSPPSSTRTLAVI